jgi:hypothetical protein
MARNLGQVVKHALVPREKRNRRLPFGIAAGIRIEIDFSIQTKMFLGLYEVELNRHIRRLVQPGYKSFDVGAQYGYDALILAKISRAAVASIECDADVLPELRRNVNSNPSLREHIRLIKAFVAAATEEGHGIVSLDDLAYGGKFFVPDFIKLDIEGGELEALLGSRRILEEHRPNLLVETHSVKLEAACVDLVRSLGYVVSIVETRRFLPDYRPVDHNRWFVAWHPAAQVRRAEPTPGRLR